jgi:hypothetical protein
MGARAIDGAGQAEPPAPPDLETVLRTWQAVEAATVEHANEVIARTKNPMVELMMEIIRHESEMHRRVQQVILDSLERQKPPMVEMERYAVELAAQSREAWRLLVRCQLLEYMSEEEMRRHGPV